MLNVVDIHPHVISTDTQRYPRAPIGGHQSTWSSERPVSVEQLIAEQDRAGVRKAALVQASTCYGHDNSYVADAVNAFPGRFAGVAFLQAADREWIFLLTAQALYPSLADHA